MMRDLFDIDIDIDLSDIDIDIDTDIDIDLFDIEKLVNVKGERAWPGPH